MGEQRPYKANVGGSIPSPRTIHIFTVAEDTMENRTLTVLTVIIRNDTPMLIYGDQPSFRSVQIELTKDQIEQMQLTDMESISQCFIEPVDNK